MYRIPQHIENDRIFIARRSEINGRLDPKMVIYNRKAGKSVFPKTKLGNLLVAKPQYGANIPGIKRTLITEPRYIRITDIDNEGRIDFNELGATANIIEDQYILNYNDILIARSGTVGKAYIHKTAPYECIFAGYLIRFIVDDSRVLPDYVFAYMQLDTYKEWVNAIQRPGVQSNINAEEYQSLEIPLPDKDIQMQIAGMVDAAYAVKKQKDDEAKHILDSIDNYILDELGINLPDTRSGFGNNIFIINRNNLENRLDPAVYKDGIKLISHVYDNVRLSTVAKLNPRASFKGLDADTPLSFIPMEAIDEKYSEITTLKESTVGESSGFTKFQEGDLLWAKIIPCMQNGKSAIARNLKNGIGCGSTEFIVLRPKDIRLSIEFLHVIMHMRCVRQTAMLYFAGSAGQQRVSSSFLENFNLPLPPVAKQQEIADHVYHMRHKARLLIEEGDATLKKTKKEIEQIILS